MGFKKLLLVSNVALVALAVGVSSYIGYVQQQATLESMIIDSSEAYTEKQAKKVESLLLEKIGGLDKLGEQFTNTPISGSERQLIDLTFTMANAMNLNSSVVAFENGVAYWNQTSKSWPNHKFNGDVTTRSWYQLARENETAVLSEPYLGSDGDIFWVSIVRKTSNGMISADMQLGFLNELAKSANELPGAKAIILNSDATILASSDESLSAGELASSSQWLAPLTEAALGKNNSMQSANVDGVDKLFFTQEISLGEKRWYFMTGIDESIAFASLTEARQSAVIFGGLAILASVAAAYLLMQIIYRPILSLRDTISKLSSGDADLTQRVEVKSNDDLGQIGEGINAFIGNLQEMIREVRSATERLNDNVNTLKSQNQKTANVLTEHLEETEEVAIAIERMNVAASSMARDAENTAELIRKADEAASSSKVTVNTAESDVSALVNGVDIAAVNVSAMSQETSGINEVLGVIGDIAEQTNLLALNAAIEAARAGEQGRGFAVVADEVRNLASRTKNSTSEIETALEGLLERNRKVVDSMEQTKQGCHNAAIGTGNVAESLDTLIQFVGDIRVVSEKIAGAADGTISVTQELSRTVSSIKRMAADIESNSHDSVNETQVIADVNGQLMRVVNRFRI